MQVLIVEDNPDIAWALSEVLRNLGHDVVSCLTPHSALEAVKSHSPDLVLLDIGLPEIDGYALAMLLRQHGLVKTPIMALSSQEDDAARRCAATIDAHYLKPVSIEQIEQILENAIDS
jgi:CheY-like chemotaxis protein